MNLVTHCVQSKNTGKLNYVTAKQKGDGVVYSICNIKLPEGHSFPKEKVLQNTNQLDFEICCSCVIRTHRRQKKWKRGEKFYKEKRKEYNKEQKNI